MRVGVIGPGRMGEQVVRRLVEVGYQPTVLARSAKTHSVLAADGIKVVGAGADVAESSDAVIVCVYNDEQVRRVCLDNQLLEQLPRGSTLVVHTTASPHTIEAIESRAAPRQIDVVDAPFSGGPRDVAAGHVTLFVGGTEYAVTRMRPVLESYGDPVLHAGPPGAGQRVKLVNNALFTAQIGLLTESVRLGAQLGLDEAVLLNTLPHGSAASRALTFAAAKGSVSEVVRSVGAFVGKDVDVVRNVAAELGGDLGVLDDAFKTLTGVA